EPLLERGHHEARRTLRELGRVGVGRQRTPRRRADDAVDRKSRARLERFDRALRPGTEAAVDARKVEQLHLHEEALGPADVAAAAADAERRARVHDPSFLRWRPATANACPMRDRNR